jgi:hypothetical protein
MIPTAKALPRIITKVYTFRNHDLYHLSATQETSPNVEKKNPLIMCPRVGKNKLFPVLRPLCGGGFLGFHSGVGRIDYPGTN